MTDERVTDIEAEWGLVPADDQFHPPETEDPWWTETVWFSWMIPERKLLGYFYPAFRANMGIQFGGVMVVDDKDRARFISIDLVASADDGVLVTGLPETVTIISVGQNYVTDGQAVAPVEDKQTSTGARDERPY